MLDFWSLRIVTVAPLLAFVLADPNDWVNVEYVISQAKGQSQPATSDAQATIVRKAGSSAGPWTVTNVKGYLPPSKDPHDFMSWAPYHWPDCNWCTETGRTHLAHTIAGPGQNTSTDGNYTSSTPDVANDPYTNEIVLSPRRFYPFKRRHISNVDLVPDQIIAPSDGMNVISTAFPALPTSTITPTPISIPFAVTATAISSSTTSRTYAPAKAAAKTTKSCMPPSTKTLAPSATWTTCPYVTRDGNVNPDVRQLNGPGAINDVAQAVIYNAIAFALKSTSAYSKNVAQLINAFFLDPTTKMNPNMNFGQIVRGPGPTGIEGTFTGILDLRGIVKIVNGIAILKSAGSLDWTQTLDQQMNSWFTDYINWLTTSSLGQMVASRPNNHATFYISQVAAAKVFMGDISGATDVLQRFFRTTFLDQIAQSGEQPFEAVRSRPFHYRCFNLEALITNAKLGDQIGLNLWAYKSKYGATIQTALDFLLKSNPNGEDVSQIFPHVAAVAAAYGDPTGKYGSYLKKMDPTYESMSYWFYDQPAAFRNSPSTSKQARRYSRKRDDSNFSTPDMSNIPFECPPIFNDVVKVEIDNDIYVSCDDLKPYYIGEFK